MVCVALKEWFNEPSVSPEAKKTKAAASETQAVAEGELEITNKALAEDEHTLKDIQMGCMTVADEHEGAMNGRAEELKALATAKKIIQNMSAGELLQTDFAKSEGPSSFLMVSSNTRTRVGARFEERRRDAVRMVKKLSQQFRSAELAQLAQWLSEIGRLGVSQGADPFETVKSMSADMIEKLLKEAPEERARRPSATRR